MTECKHKRYTVNVREQTGNCIDCGAEGRMRFVVDGEIDRLQAIEAAALDFLKTLDRMDDGCRNLGFRGWENGHGESCGDDAQDARDTLARLLFNTMYTAPPAEAAPEQEK
jgi:hypothetical protein